MTEYQRRGAAYEPSGSTDAITKAVHDARQGYFDSRLPSEWYALLEKHVRAHQQPEECFYKAFNRLTLRATGATLMRAYSLSTAARRHGPPPVAKEAPDRSGPDIGSITALRKKRDDAQERVDEHIETLMKRDPGLTYERAFAKCWMSGSPVFADVVACRELEAQIRRREGR